MDKTKIKWSVSIWALNSEPKIKEEEVFAAEAGKPRKAILNSGIIAHCFYYRPEKLILNC